MPAPASVDELLKLIRKSGMVDEPRLDAYLERYRSSGGPTNDVRKLAGAMVRDGLLTYFQAEQFMLGKWRGFTIGKYKLLERIGFGGMGQVFLCEHMYMRRRVAIKVLPPAKAEEPAALGRFYREARAAAALDHPNIVRTHDIDQDGNLHFLVMEYVDGSSLLEMVKKKGPMAADRAAHYIWQSVQGLDHAYRVGVIHRDIKPGNILVDRFGISKILDMGLARFYNSDDDMLTKKYDEKSVLGTADYVAPEQTVNSHDVDVRADLYSLGATFYFLLAGHPPFPEGTISQKLIAHQTKKPTPIRQIRPDVPAELAAVLEGLMEKSLENRFQTPAEVYEALLPFVQGPMALPPDDEMPVLSPAAREAMGLPGMGGTSGNMSGSFRQDSAILRAEILQRSGRMAAPAAGSGRSPVPPPQSSGRGSSGLLNRPGGSSSKMPPPYFDSPPASSPLGSAAIPPIPNPTSPVNETARMGQSTTERTPNRESRQDHRHDSRDQGYRRPETRGLNPISNPVLRIILESVLIFGLCLLIFFIVRGL
ncbi:serine/threonine protein kinase [Zavarzinella formosa]|uniref:serine/threonine protein kinase n=1 Tax=Zavarzinella formosa TaxID=360055 RepID=UPI0002E612E4|nr:serine/threonine-protein kinase [Zavarzinella formosa]